MPRGLAEVIAAWAARYVGEPPARMASERGQVVVEETGARQQRA